jgi:hypothetical protein
MVGKGGDPRMHKPDIVLVAHSHRLPVRASVEHDLLILGQRGIDNCVKLEQIAEWRLSARFAAGANVRRTRSMPMSPAPLLDRLADFERRVCRVYEALGERLDFPAAVRGFWTCMAQDEQCHAAILEGPHPTLTETEAPSAASENAIAILQAKAEAAEAAVRRADLSRDEAFRVMLMLEDAELNALDEVWFQGLRPVLGSLLETLLPEAETHVRRVVETIHTWSTDHTLQCQAAALWSTYERQKLAYANTRSQSEQQLER